jgi:penicillin-binding protein 1A
LKNPNGSAIQRDAVLDRMVALKKITPSQAEQAKKTKIVTHPKRMPQIQENYAMDAVQRALSLILTQDQMDDGGLSIYTTLDPSVQNATQDALESIAQGCSRGDRSESHQQLSVDIAVGPTVA